MRLGQESATHDQWGSGLALLMKFYGDTHVCINMAASVLQQQSWTAETARPSNAGMFCLPLDD